MPLYLFLDLYIPQKYVIIYYYLGIINNILGMFESLSKNI